MFVLQAEKSKLTMLEREQITSGSVNIYRVRFEFSEDWDGLAKTVYFRSGTQTIPLLLPESDECFIPWEVTDPDDAGKTLYAGVCGTLNGKIVLPTVETSLGVIMPGTNSWPSSQPPTPGLYEQILYDIMKKQDKLTGLPGQIVGFDVEGNAVPVDMPSGGGGEGTEGQPDPPGADTSIKIGHGLKQDENGVVSVDTVDDFTGDNTLPMTAAGVQSVVGNIDVILGTI